MGDKRCYPLMSSAVRPEDSGLGCANEDSFKRKELFEKPALTPLGDLMDLTGQFGGSLTPQERQDLGLDGLEEYPGQ
jgi:hypothetical protein